MTSEEIQKSVVTSLDGSDEKLYPFLDYLLQDLWEIGSSPDVMIQLIRKHNLHQDGMKKVLDLGCGKGIISIHLAKEFEFKTHGIDAFPPFIREAKFHAKKHDVASLCIFENNDIRSRLAELNGYDIVVLGSIGPILGDIEETISQVKNCLNPGGIILIDDGYIPDDSSHTLQGLHTRSEAVNKIIKCSVKILDEYIYKKSYIQASNQYIFEKIDQRAHELISRHPEKAALLKGYLKKQEEENDILTNWMCCVTWVLQKSENKQQS